MRKSLYITVLLLLLVACNKELKDVIKVTPQRASFRYDGGLGQISVTASVAWEAVSDAQWIVIDSTTKNIVFYHVEANRAETSRRGSITISGSGKSHQVLIEQTLQPARAADSLALATLAKECDGQNWRFGKDTAAKPWLLEKPITTWDGVTTSMVDGDLRVIGLNLAGAQLVGDLPNIMRDLTAMQILNLRQNGISGNVISIVASMPNLLYLDISRNKHINYADTPPAGSFAKLQYLDLSVCPINGPIPSWALLPGLVELSVANSNISGEIPSEIAEMTDLTRLDLSNNKITGMIPSWITLLRRLTYLDLATCHLTGEIPEDIGDLSSLQVFKAAYNKMIGTIPVSIAKMKNLNTLNLSGNGFTNFPATIVTNCNRLKHVDISFNNIEGELVPQWAALQYLEELMVLGNRMSGEIPSELLNDSRWSNVWFARSLICPQQAGYGFSNNPYKVGSGTRDVKSGE